jgi:hypothetical protein
MKTLRFAVILAAAALLSVVGALLHGRKASAQAVPDVVRAQAFELVDASGQVRATLDARGAGVVLKLLDANGTIRAKLGADVDGSGLVLANEQTKVGIHALATRSRTWIVVARDHRRRVIRP